MQALSQLSYSPICTAVAVIVTGVSLFVSRLSFVIEAIILSFPAKPRLYNSLAFLQAPISLFYCFGLSSISLRIFAAVTAAVLP
ncbi:hypothetical protein [Cupriavidus sp. H18C1]|uniref:hypothetical protein n=1 Tax=Cupriavidus sp. H18C1 TaxID=3241601 RepID=UPI003BB8DDDE